MALPFKWQSRYNEEIEKGLRGEGGKPRSSPLIVSYPPPAPPTDYMPTRVRRVAPIPEAPTLIEDGRTIGSLPGALPQFGGAVRQRKAVSSAAGLTDVPAPGGPALPLPAPTRTASSINIADTAPPAGESPVPLHPPPPGFADFNYQNLGTLGRKQQELAARQQAAQFGTGVHDTGTGYGVTPPKTRAETNSWKNRLKQLGLGALQGIAMLPPGADMGSIIGAGLGGGATGAISPRLVEAYMREQEIRKLRGEIAQEQELELGRAKIGTELLRPELEMLRINRQLENDKSLKESRETRAKQADEANRIRRENLNRQRAKDEADANKPATVDAVAAEGEEASEQAERAASDIKKELDSLKGDFEAGKQAVIRKDALYKARAAEIYKKAPSDRKPTMAEALALARSEDDDYVKGTYDETVTNTEAKQRRIEQLEKELLDINKERRGGASKAARRTPKKVSSDGKYHYTLDEIKRQAGDNWEEVLRQLKARDNVVID